MNINLIFQALAGAILVGFWAIFFAKMAAQKRQGVSTGFLRRGGKSKAVFATELVAKAAVFLTVTAQIVSIALDIFEPILWLRIAGAVAGALGVVVFLLAVRTMADSWRAEIPDNYHPELVTSGIFRFSRNPAFLGFDLVFAGVAMMFFNPWLAAVSVVGMVGLHLQILREEKYLRSTFGAQYIDYQHVTRRYF